MSKNIHEDCKDVILTEEEIQETVDRLGSNITDQFSSDEVLLVGVLRGSVVFMSDLMRSIDLDLEIDFLAVGSYGDSTKSSGVVRVHKDLDEDIEGRTVLLVEDIVDTGLTLNFLLGYLESRNPADLYTCSLLDKPARREVEVDVDLIGEKVPDEFLVGYGLDYGQKYRNLPYIAKLKDEVISND